MIFEYEIVYLGTIPKLHQQRDWVGGVRKMAIFADVQYFLCQCRVGQKWQKKSNNVLMVP